MRTLALACLVSGAATVAAAQDHTDTLFVSGQADFLQAGNGGTGGVDWLRKGQRHGVRAGFQSGSLPGVWWTYARAGGFSRWRRLLVSGALDAGGGVQGGARFGYRKIGAEAGVLLAGGRIVVETEGQIARLTPESRRALRLGAKWRPAQTVTAGGSYHLVFVDGAAVPAVSVRLDAERGRALVLGGAVFARREPSKGLLSHIGPRLTTTEFFGGAAFRLRSCRVQMVANVAPSDRHASRLMASLEIPLKR